MKYLLLILKIIVLNLAAGVFNVHAEGIKFVQITDPHIFEPDNKDKESRNSLIYFYLAIEKANQLNLHLQKKGQNPLDFVLLSGDLGIEKLLTEVDLETHPNALPIELHGKKLGLIKDTKKWNKALSDLATMLQDSDVKTWLFVPGNNDIYEDDAKTIIFYENFLEELQALAQIQKANIKIVDFRLEAKTGFFNKQPGVYKKENLIVVGFDNSFFKNSGSVKTFLDKNNKPKPMQDTLEYKRITKLADVLKGSKEKYAYIFLHIPEVDDPWLTKFDVNDASEKNPVYKRFRKISGESEEIAKTIYPYSSWIVPGYIRKYWEDVVTNKAFGTPEVKGLFTGHFHDKEKSTYMGFHWLKSEDYSIKILNKLFISPTVSVKNQLTYLEQDCARGMQYINIDDKTGTVKRKIFWLYGENDNHN